MNFLLIGLICLANLSVDAQVLRRVCKSHINHLKMMDQDPRYANKRAALELLSIHDSSRNSSNRAVKKSTSLTIYQIPVVVHVIHNGEPEGTNPNISQGFLLLSLCGPTLLSHYGSSAPAPSGDSSALCEP